MMSSQFAQYYTTALHFDGDTALHYVVLPSRSLKDESAPGIGSIIDQMNITPAIDVSPSQLASALSALLSYEMLTSLPKDDPNKVPLRTLLDSAPANKTFKFAEYAAYSKVVPYESSPLGADTLGNIVNDALGYIGAGGTVVGGAKLGMFVAGAAGLTASVPVLVISAAGGVVLVLTAQAALSEVGKGIGRQVLRWMGFETGKSD